MNKFFNILTISGIIISIISIILALNGFPGLFIFLPFFFVGPFFKSFSKKDGE